MFDQLSERLSHSLRNIRGQGRISEKNISNTLREVRMALLEADVALPVVREFLDRVRDSALGREIQPGVSPGQFFVRIVHQELTALMGEQNPGLQLAAKPPVVILLAGLQGAGKTTTAAKLGVWLRQREKKRVMVCSCDVYRPAAMEQLRTLAMDNELIWQQDPDVSEPESIVDMARRQAESLGADVLLVDTAGRLHVDDAMMREMRQLHKRLQPQETLFVIDSMMGQDAVNVARVFADAVPLTGVVLSKIDGDARGGVALTVRSITGVPIKFMGTGEKADALELFHPERIASRILGMGDVLSLVEEMEQRGALETSARQAKKLARKGGGGFNLEDMREQLLQVQNMGGVDKLLEKLPGVGQQVKNAAVGVGDGHARCSIAIIDSMTRRERRRPDIINGSRKRRIATGSGTRIQEVNRLLKEHKQMQKMMKRMSSKGGMRKMMRHLGGGLPPGMQP